MINNTDYSDEKGFLFYLKDLEYRLKNKGFDVDKYADRNPYKLRPFKLDFLAVKKGFKLGIITKSITIVIATYIENVSTDIINKFSSSSFDYAYENYNTPKIPGEFRAIIVYPVIVSHNFDENIIKWMRKHKVKKHYAAFEIPVLVSIDNREIYYREKTPLWGALYYDEFIRFIKEYLSF